MAEVRLQRPGVGALVRQRVARGVAQHVRMHFEWHLGLDPDALDHLLQAGYGEGRAALAGEDEGRLGVPLERPQCPHFIAQQWVRAGLSALGPAQVQGAGGEFNVGPLQAAKLRNPQAMPEGHQKHRTIPLAPAVALGGLN